MSVLIISVSLPRPLVFLCLLASTLTFPTSISSSLSLCCRPNARSLFSSRNPVLHGYVVNTTPKTTNASAQSHFTPSIIRESCQRSRYIFHILQSSGVKPFDRRTNRLIQPPNEEPNIHGSSDSSIVWCRATSPPSPLLAGGRLQPGVDQPAGLRVRRRGRTADRLRLPAPLQGARACLKNLRACLVACLTCSWARVEVVERERGRRAEDGVRPPN